MHWDAQIDAALSVYDIQRDDQDFRDKVKSAEDFVHSRKHYAMRREYASTPIFAGNSHQLKALYRLGFLNLLMVPNAPMFLAYIKEH